MRVLLVFVLVLSCFLGACTANQRAKRFGGATTIDLPAKRKLVTATWKESSLWILTRPMREGEPIEAYEFKEDSSLGLMEGTVVLKEH